MLKIPKESPTISKEEIDIIDLENRRKALESSCFDATESKRKIEKDIVRIQEDIKTGKDIIEQNNKKIVEINQSVLDVQNYLRGEQQKLQELEKSVSIKREEIRAEVADKNRQLGSIISAITSSEKTRQNNRFNSEEELRDIKVEQSKVLRSEEHT